MEGKEGEEKGAVEDIIVANCLGCEGGAREEKEHESAAGKGEGLTRAHSA